MVDVSLVLPFRDRDPRRLGMTARSLIAACEGLTFEFIIADGGSRNTEPIAEVAHAINARIVWQQHNHWNKPAVLNEAISIARGEYVLCADTDMLWSPHSVVAAVNKLRRTPGDGVLAFQTRDLPPAWTEPILTGEVPDDWRSIRQASKLHSRWGNGVLLFLRRRAQEAGGYDARLSVYGTEDLDFCLRLQRLGAPFLWSDPARSQVFHVWHPTLQKREQRLPWAKRALERNRNILRNDKSVVRNVVGGGVASDAPLVSVAIATQNRSEMLRTALASVLCQTVQSFEVIVVDDGSSDDTADVVAAFDDERIRYIRQEPAGISVARNRALDEARGRFTAVMDDDDIMPPWRLERSFERIHGSEHGCVGSFVTFDDMSGDLVAWADPFPTMLGAYPNGGFAGHPTWMVRTDVLRAFRYDESFTSAVDNNIALRMLRAGVRLRHAGAVLNLRRVHGGQVTSLDSAFQGRGARLDATWLRSGSTAAEIREQADEAKSSQMSGIPSSVQQAEVVAFLPDHLVDRTIWVRSELEASAAEILQRLPRASSIEVAQADGTSVVLLCVEGATWADCAFVATRPETTILEWHGRHRNDSAAPPQRDSTSVLQQKALLAVLQHWAARSDLKVSHDLRLVRGASLRDGRGELILATRESDADTEAPFVTIRMRPKDRDD